MLPYDQVIAGASTNVTTPTTEEINQGNNTLTPYNSAVNNGYYRQMSQGVFNLSAELENVITAAGLTPDSSLDQLLEAINILKIPADASETVKGIIEIATNSEVAAATDTVRAIVPSALASLFGTSSRSANGYVRLPVIVGGAFVEIIVQWVKGVNTTTGDSTQTVNFPLTFPNAVLGCCVSTINSTTSTSADAWFQEDSKTTSAIVVRAQWTGTGSVAGGVTPQIIAIGY